MSRSAREELQHEAIHFGGVLVGGPVAGPGNAVQVEGADGPADLADQEVGGSELRVVALAPEETYLAGELREVAEQGAAGAHLAAVEAGAPDAISLDVEGVLRDARGIAQHIDEQVVAADLPEERLVVSRFPVTPRGPLPEGPRRESGRRDEAEMRHARGETTGEVGGDGRAEGEPGEAQRRGAREHLDEQAVHEVQVGGAGDLAGHRGRGAVPRMIEGVHGEPPGEGRDVTRP